MSQNIQIKRILPDGQVLDLIEFNQIPFVHKFYEQRGLTTKTQHKTNAITIRMLRRELLKEIERLRKENNVSIKTCIQLQATHDALDKAIRTQLKKEDKLLLINSLPLAL